MAQMRYPAFSPTAIFIIAWGNAPGIERATLSHIRFPRGDAPGYGVHGRWPIRPVVMFDGPNAIPGFFANGDIHRSLGLRPRSGEARYPMFVFPGALPLAMVCMAVGQSDRS